MVLYHTMILILPRALCFHRVLQQGQHFFSCCGDTCHQVIRWLVDFCLIGRKRRRVEPHTYVVVLRVLRVLRVLEGNKVRKINVIEGKRPLFMG